jgi:hypothetical protein
MKKFKAVPAIPSSHGDYCFGDSRSRGNEAIYIGRLAELGPLRRVYFDVSGEHVVAIVGKRGSGKSYTLGSIIEGLCTRDRETSISHISRSRAVLLLDTLNIYWTTAVKLSRDLSKETVREQSENLTGWDVKPEDLDTRIWVPAGHRTAGMPLGFCDFRLNTADFSASDWGSLLDLDILQDRMGQLVNDVFQKVTAEGWSGGSGSRAPKSAYSIPDLLECIREDTEIQHSYHTETIRAVTQQLTYWNRNPVFSCEGTGLPELLVPGRLSVILTASLSEELRCVLVGVLVRKILQARSEASFDLKRLKTDSSLTPEEEKEIEARLHVSVPPSWIVIDEAQNVIPPDRKVTSLHALTRLVKEGRNFGLSVAFTTQQPSAVENRIMSQVDTLIVHKLAVQGDIDEVRRSLKCGEPTEVRYGNTELSLAGLLRTLDMGQCLVSNTELDRYFLLDVRPRISVHGGFEA